MSSEMVLNITQNLSLLIGIAIILLAMFDAWCYPKSRAFLIIGLIYGLHLAVFYVAVQFFGAPGHVWSSKLRIHGATSLVVVLYSLAERAWRARLWKRGFLI